MRTSLCWIGLGLGVLACAPAPLAQELHNPAPRWVPYEEITFHRPIPIVAPEMAALWGDRDQGASGNLEKQPAGAVSALHVHPNDTYALVLRGRMTHQFEGGPAAPVLGPGSFYTLPADAPHVSTCLAGEDCLIAYWQPGPLGYTEVDPGEKPSRPGLAQPAAEVAFSGAAGRSSAPLWGDPSRGRVGVMERIAPGAGVSFDATGETHGVVLTGALRREVPGQAAQTLGPGSYLVLPAGHEDRATCSPTTECRLWLFFPSPQASQ